MRSIFGATLLVLLFALVHGQRFVPIDKMTDQDVENWIKPPNRQVFQRLLLDRMLRTMDPRADPCDDFYQYACGNYDAVRPQNKEVVIPLHEITFLSTSLISKIIESTANYSAGSSERKVWNFFRSCMDIKRDPHTPMDYVRSFGSWPAFDNYWRPESFDWIQRMVELMKVGVNVFFEAGNDAQRKGKIYLDTLNIELAPSGLYAEPTTERELLGKLRTLFSAHLPASYIDDMSRRMTSFHNQLHRFVADPTPEDFYIHELPRAVPSCDLTRIVHLLINKTPNPSNTLRVPKNYIEKFCALVERTDKRTVADTMLYYLYIDAQKKLSELSMKDEKSLHVLCISETGKKLQPILAKMFVEKHVSEQSLQEVEELSKAVQKVGVEMMMSETKWLDETTRNKAIKKMEAISTHVVYPDPTEEPDTTLLHIDIDPTNYLQNYKRLKAVDFEKSNRLIGKSAGSMEFDTLEVNPSLMPDLRGHMRIQAAALFPAFHSIFAPSFQTFGSIAAALGHEFMHAFDARSGVNKDEFGENKPWISPSRELAHQIRSECFYTQFENFKIDGTDLHVQGALTMGENVADNDGLKIAFKLFKRWLAENPDKVWQEEFSFAPLQLNHQQAFFLSYGQMWCEYRTLDELINLVKTDPHSPAKFRVIAGVSNSYDFAKAFNCPANSKMNPSEKCKYFFD